MHLQWVLRIDLQGVDHSTTQFYSQQKNMGRETAMVYIVYMFTNPKSISTSG